MAQICIKVYDDNSGEYSHLHVTDYETASKVYRKVQKKFTEYKVFAKAD